MFCFDDDVLSVSYLLERQVVGEGALHVVVFAGRVHVVGAYLQDTEQRFGLVYSWFTGVLWPYYTPPYIELHAIWLQQARITTVLKKKKEKLQFYTAYLYYF